jgi:hypothetical protein
MTQEEIESWDETLLLLADPVFMAAHEEALRGGCSDPWTIVAPGVVVDSSGNIVSMEEEDND